MHVFVDCLFFLLSGAIFVILVCLCVHVVLDTVQAMQHCGNAFPLRLNFLYIMSDPPSLQMGVSQPSYKRKLMAAITEVHQRQWEMPKTSNLPYGRTIRCEWVV